MTWQPIETAPRDGTEILLTNINHHGELKDSSQQVAAWWGDGSAGHWVVYCSMVQDPDLYFEPSHWQPLPDPPGSEAGDQDCGATEGGLDPCHLVAGHDGRHLSRVDNSPHPVAWHEGEIGDAPDPPPQSCGTCRFWMAYPSDHIGPTSGMCRRFPPARPFTDTKTDLIHIDEGNWCGEWAARKVEPLPADICPTTGGEHAWLDTTTNDGDSRKCLKCGMGG